MTLLNVRRFDAQVARQFGLLDDEGTGYIGTNQLEQLMSALGIQLNPAQLQQVRTLALWMNMRFSLGSVIFSANSFRYIPV